VTTLFPAIACAVALIVLYIAVSYLRRAHGLMQSMDEMFDVALGNLAYYNRHDERVAELLAYNNEQLERARAAERDFTELDKMTDVIEQENDALQQRNGDLLDQIEALKADNLALLENQVLTEQELVETKKALQSEEDQANDWASRYHRDIGKTAEATAH